ncbi:choice-of-anchor Q domain-containing protein [Lamprobacter modestohalophilus]|uniref:InlB B-repeat-containing protein n=1 Tax=Lamprobacter modestohalophilus TaxID=1064514 RepID=UPI002ADEBA55|nr:choice-of-anchor Q domain-containing protein [Lamprobacter modestohalophilus]MEA1053316.1 choice-of-anchor Q domain-containing protein [Lamprobacter modestohalophilus]
MRLRNQSAHVLLSLLLLGLAILASSSAGAAVFCVDSATALQNALLSAAANAEDDEVQIVQGTYVGNFVYGSLEQNALTVEGGYTIGCGRQILDAENTVLDGNRANAVLALAGGGEAADFSLRGVTLRNGERRGSGGGLVATTGGVVTIDSTRIIDNAATEAGGGASISAYGGEVFFTNNLVSGNVSEESGGGIHVEARTGIVTVTDNRILENSVQGSAAGIYIGIRAGSAIVKSNTVESNIASSGYYSGGVWVDGYQGRVVFDNNIILNNANEVGGGIQISLESAWLTNNLIANNSASQSGGGLHLDVTNLVFTNNTVAANIANDDGNEYGEGGGVFVILRGRETSSSATFSNNLFWDNLSVASTGDDLWIVNDRDNDFIPVPVAFKYNNFNQTLGRGFNSTIPVSIDPSNLDAIDPVFVDAENDDFTLSLSSPMIDMGDPETPDLPEIDLAGNPRVHQGVVDIGAYEWVGDNPQATLTVRLSGTGEGNVASDPLGIDCGSDCSEHYVLGSEVTLIATAAASSELAGWSVAACGRASSCTLTMDAAKTIVVTFNETVAPVHSIEATASPSSGGRISCDPNPVLDGDSSTCTAAPSDGYSFTRWSGDCSGSNPSCTLSNVSVPQRVFATFSESGITAEQSARSYVPGETLTVTGVFNDTSGDTPRSLVWSPEVPSGWTITSVSGDGVPQLNGNDILFTGRLTPPLAFSYEVDVPTNATSEEAITAVISYQSDAMVNPVTLIAEPDPLWVVPIGRHSADYQDEPWVIDAIEASRVLSYWRAGGYHVNPAGADRYAMDAGSTEGNLHSADYRDPRWRIDSGEANRVLAYWRLGGYQADPAGDDGYAPPGLARIARAMPIAHAALRVSQQASDYRPGTSLKVSNRIGSKGDSAPLSLLWRLHLPKGWSITAISGEGSPELSADGSEILFTAVELTLPLHFSYSIAVPADARGTQPLSAELEYWQSATRNTATTQPKMLFLESASPCTAASATPTAISTASNCSASNSSSWMPPKAAKPAAVPVNPRLPMPDIRQIPNILEIKAD